MQCKEQTKVLLISSAHLANGCLVSYSLVNLTFAYIHFRFERVISKTLIRFCFPVTQLFGQAVARPPTLPLDPSRKGAVTNSLLCIFQTITVRNASQCVLFWSLILWYLNALLQNFLPYEASHRACARCDAWHCAQSHAQVKNSHFKCAVLECLGRGGVCSQSITYFMLHHIIFWFNYFLHDFRSFFFTLSWFVKYSNCKKVSWLYVQFTFSTSVIMFLYVCCHAHTPDSHTSQRKVECGNVTACHSLTNVLLLCHSRLMYASFCFLGSQHHSSTSFPPSGSSHSG